LKRAFKADTIENYINLTIAEMSASALGIPLAIIAIMMIKAYSKKEVLLDNIENKMDVS